MMTGHAIIPAIGRNVQVENGEIRFENLPLGTWGVVLRALGYHPASFLIDAGSDLRGAATTVELQRIAQLLDPVTVLAASSNADRAVLAAIEKRMRVSSGTLIRADNLSLRNATEASQGLTAARGFTYKGLTKVEARPFGLSGAPCATDKKIGNKEVAIYLDGERYPGGLQMINDAIRPTEILAIEAYPDVISAPFLWRTNDACAVVAFWTKR